MNLGFTGSRRGPVSELQLEAFERFLDARKGTFRHGDCKGWDELAEGMARERGWWTMAYPGTDRNGSSPTRAHTHSHEIVAPAPYLVRDKEIVLASGEMVACPKDFWVPRSLMGQGTWWTATAAYKLGVPCTVILPDGSAVDITACILPSSALANIET